MPVLRARARDNICGMNDQGNSRPENLLKAAWKDESGQKWARLQPRMDLELGPIGLPAVEALAPRPGMRVLDVGCGAGQTLFQLAERVDPDGWVTGLDISEPLAALARARIAASGRARIDVQVGDAEEVRLAEPYDALFSRFGVMFFDDQAAAFANLARALRPGGRLSFVCWQPLDVNPWADLPLRAVRSMAPETALPDMVLPDRPGPFRFGDPNVVRTLLSGAGFADVAVTPHEAAMAFGGSRTVDEAVEIALNIGPAARLASQLAPELRPRVIEALARVFEPALTGDGIRMRASTFVVTARRG